MSPSIMYLESVIILSSWGFGVTSAAAMTAIVTFGLHVRYDWICEKLVTHLYLNELILGAL